MARLRRFCPVGLPQHIIQRGNNRQVCFASSQDFAVYANWLYEYSVEFDVSVHAWVFMTNHIHLLATPNKREGLSKMMQALGRRYVRYFNREYSRSGTLWEGRFKSCLVQSDKYLLICQRYIELNPVRAGMVVDPSEYAWSSYSANALGKRIRLCTPHEQYLHLDKNEKRRLEIYRDLFKVHVSGNLIAEISATVNQGLALGNSKFKEEIEQLYQRRVTRGVVGRPRLEN